MVYSDATLERQRAYAEANAEELRREASGVHVGSRVRAHGLVAAADLNGELGIVEKSLPETGRWQVVFDNKKLSKRQANIKDEQLEVHDSEKIIQSRIDNLVHVRSKVVKPRAHVIRDAARAYIRVNNLRGQPKETSCKELDTALERQAYQAVKDYPLERLDALIAEAQEFARGKDTKTGKYVTEAKDEGAPAHGEADADGAPEPKVNSGIPGPAWTPSVPYLLLKKQTEKRKRSRWFRDWWLCAAAHDSAENRCSLLFDMLDGEEKVLMHDKLQREAAKGKSNNVTAQWARATAWDRVGPQWAARLSEYRPRVRMLPFDVVF